MSYLKELEEAKEAYADLMASTKDSSKIVEYSNRIRVLDIQISKAKNEKTYWFDSLPNNPICLNKKILFKKESEGI